MKRIISILLAVAMTFASFGICASAKNECDCGDAPIVIVSGFATVPIYLDEGTENEDRVWVPQTKYIVSAVFKAIGPLMRLLITGDWDTFNEKLCPLVMSVFENGRCDANGDSIYNVSVRDYPLAAENYPDFVRSDNKDEQALMLTAIPQMPANHVYFFSYDWRIDPMETAKKLDFFVENVKCESGHDKVSMVSCSMGGAIAMAYLQQSGTDDLRTFILDNTAFQGMELFGELFNQKFALDKEFIIDYILQYVNLSDKAEGNIKKLLMKGQLVDNLISLAMKLVEKSGPSLFEEVLYPFFAYCPGMWTLVSHDEYESAKDKALDREINKELIKRIDYYHYEVQCKSEELLKNAIADGCNVAVLACYNIMGLPITASYMLNNDMLISTKLSSGGAICADYGETLPEDYIQAVSCGHNHISADRVVDASACILPEHTWFIKDMKHLDFPYQSEAADFLMWLVMLDEGEQPTVASNEKCPQFMRYNKADKTLSIIE